MRFSPNLPKGNRGGGETRMRDQGTGWRGPDADAMDDAGRGWHAKGMLAACVVAARERFLAQFAVRDRQGASLGRLGEELSAWVER